MEKTTKIYYGEAAYARRAKDARLFNMLRAAGTLGEYDAQMQQGDYAYRRSYEAKLHIIATLDPEAEFEGTPVVLLINELTKKAGQMSEEEVRAEVDRILGAGRPEEEIYVDAELVGPKDNPFPILFTVILDEVTKKTKAIVYTPDESDPHSVCTLLGEVLDDPNSDGNLMFVPAPGVDRLTFEQIRGIPHIEW